MHSHLTLLIRAFLWHPHHRTPLLHPIIIPICIIIDIKLNNFIVVWPETPQKVIFVSIYICSTGHYIYC